jgi:hypothetical protein
MDKEFINTLKQKEKELDELLQNSPTYKQLLAVRAAITSFENNNKAAKEESKVYTPEKYNKDGKWEYKITYALNILKSGTVSDIVDVLKKEDPLTEDKIKKRVTVTCSDLLANNKLKKAGLEGRSFVYALNK